MSSRDLPLHDSGIFRNLPTFPDSVTNLSAVVTGANGISGFHTMRVLLESPSRWRKVYALSRRPPPPEMMALLPADHRTRLEHIAVDFLETPDAIAAAMKKANVVADYIFFYSYAQPRQPEGQGAWNNAEELVEVNSALLRNFLAALPQAGITPKRILLQTGAKNYGVHLGPIRQPGTESDPRIDIEPNFYYPQEDLLYAYCRANPATSYNIICPAWIIGAVTSAAMNALHPLAVYAAVCARRGTTMRFPGDIETWQRLNEHSSAKLTGYLSEWAVLEDRCKNQKFNAGDASPLPMNRLWPELSRWYGANPAPHPELDPAKLITLPSDPSPGPLGYGARPPLRISFTLSDWARDPANAAAWRDIAREHALTHDPFADVEAHWPFADAAAWALNMELSGNKTRYFGWTGFVDTMESLFQTYGEMHKLGMLPPLVADKARPLI